MPANVCPACGTPWPHVEIYLTTFGSKAQRSTNGLCPICEVPTAYSTKLEPLTPEEQDDVFEQFAAQQREDAFERWYADHETDKLREEVEQWLTSGAV